MKYRKNIIIEYKGDCKDYCEDIGVAHNIEYMEKR